MEQPNQVHETALCSDHLSHTDVGHTAPFQVAASVQTQALAAIAPQRVFGFSSMVHGPAAQIQTKEKALGFQNSAWISMFSRKPWHFPAVLAQHKYELGWYL